MKRFEVTVSRTYIVYDESETVAKVRAAAFGAGRVISSRELPPIESEAKGPEIDRWGPR